jgi:hypothetical protein
MRTRTALLALFCFTAASGCMFGKNAAKLTVAGSPLGTMAKLRTASGTLNGELIEMRDQAMIFRDRDHRLLIVPYNVIQSFTPDGLKGLYLITPTYRPVGERKSRLASISHFPQGMTPEIQRRILQEAKQDDFITIR